MHHCNDQRPIMNHFAVFSILFDAVYIFSGFTALYKQRSIPSNILPNPHPPTPPPSSHPTPPLYKLLLLGFDKEVHLQASEHCASELPFSGSMKKKIYMLGVVLICLSGELSSER